MLCFVVYAIAMCFSMFVLCILVMRKCLQYLRCLHMIMRIYVWTGGWNTYDEKCMYVVMFGLHMLERYVFIALAYMGKRMLMHLVVACTVWWSGEPTFLFVVIGRATIFLLRSIRGVRDGLRGVIDRDWVHSNLRSVRDGLRDFIDVSRCLCGL